MIRLSGNIDVGLVLKGHLIFFLLRFVAGSASRVNDLSGEGNIAEIICFQYGPVSNARVGRLISIKISAIGM